MLVALARQHGSVRSRNALAMGAVYPGSAIDRERRCSHQRPDAHRRSRGPAAASWSRISRRRLVEAGHRHRREDVLVQQHGVDQAAQGGGRLVGLRAAVGGVPEPDGDRADHRLVGRVAGHRQQPPSRRCTDLVSTPSESSSARTASMAPVRSWDSAPASGGGCGDRAIAVEQRVGLGVAGRRRVDRGEPAGGDADPAGQHELDQPGAGDTDIEAVAVYGGLPALS